MIGAPVRRDIEWTEKLGDDQPPVIYRVSLFAGKVAWQRKSKGAEEWETPKILPDSAWTSLLEEMEKLSQQYGLGFCNVFHAGDGNLHPLIIFDVMKEGEFERAEAFGADILRLCVKVGGVLSGEHGVGIEKRDLMTEMFSEADLDQQHRVKCAFDSQGLFNPGKVFPTLSACVEQGHIHVHGAQLPHPHLPRY